MVARELSGQTSASNVLPGYWILVADPQQGPVLRLSRDEAGTKFFLTPTEAKAEALRLETGARLAAEARIRELEAELARRQG